MQKPLFLAVDLGTSFIKAGAYDEGGARHAAASRPVKDERPGPGVFIQRGEELFAAVLDCMKDVSSQLESRSGQVEAIVFSGQMSGFMGVGKDWEDITTWSCSLDSRYMPYAKRQMETLQREFMDISGTNFPQMAPKYAWFRGEFPEQSRKIQKYLMISGYVIGRLCRLPLEDAVIDRSYLAWTGLADLERGGWSRLICDAIGLEERYLPRIVDCSHVCGHLAEPMARLTGLTPGVPVVAGAGDKVAGCLGAGGVRPGTAVFEASSYGEISCAVREFRTDPARRYDILCAAVPGLFYATHFAAGSGITLDWYIDRFYRRDGEDKADAFRRMEHALRDVPAGSRGVMALGLLAGSSMPLNDALGGMWMGFDWSHTPADLYRALLEGFAYDFAIAMEGIDSAYPDDRFREVRAIGGGVKSPTWMQMNADVSGKRYLALARRDVSMWGAVLLAGHAVGLFPDLIAAAEGAVTVGEEYIPDEGLGALYRRYLEVYRSFMETLGDHFRRIALVEKEHETV